MDRKIVFIALLFTTLSFNINTASAAITANWGDVVDVNYSLWTDPEHQNPKSGNIDVTLNYIYLSYGSEVPPEVSSLYSEANPNYLTKFKEAVIGLEVNEEKEFMIAKEDAYGNEDLYYRIKLYKIWYDASGSSAPEESTTTRTNTPIPFQDYNAIFIIGAAITVVVGGFIIWNFQSSRKTRSIVSKESLGSSMREQTFKKEKDALKEIRELTDSYLTNSDSSKDQPEMKFRRRRK